MFLVADFQFSLKVLSINSFNDLENLNVCSSLTKIPGKAVEKLTHYSRLNFLSYDPVNHHQLKEDLNGHLIEYCNNMKPNHLIHAMKLLIFIRHEEKVMILYID